MSWEKYAASQLQMREWTNKQDLKHHFKPVWVNFKIKPE